MPGKEHLALKLKKALYGTKQGGNQWRKTLEHFMQEILEWTCSEHDRAAFFKSWNDGSWAIVGFWFDDVTSIGHEHRLLQLEDAFSHQFGISGQDDVHWILGMALTHDNKTNSIFISQKNYIEDMATKFNVRNTKPPKIPIPLGIDFSAITNDEQQKNQMKDYPY